MSPDQQQRIQGRMAEWARMTPAERGEARLRFIQSQRTGTGAEDREQRWDAYQALPNEQKKQFAARAAAPPASATPAQKPRAGKPRLQTVAKSVSPTAKSNLVTNPNFGAQPQAISPTMLKAGPGASTTTVTKPPTPPPHQQTGLPKIAATPGFVDKATLLPKRGPQGAAATPIARRRSERRAGTAAMTDGTGGRPAEPSTSPLQSALQAPGLWRRMACFVYEGVLLFGVVMIAGYLFRPLTQQRHALTGRHGLQAFLFVVLAIYFVWFWSHGGQTVAMRAWHIRVVDVAGRPISQARGLARYLRQLSVVRAGIAVAVDVGADTVPANSFGILLAGVAPMRC